MTQQAENSGAIMPYPEYCFVDTAFGGVENRNHLIKLTEIKGYARKWKEENKKPYTDFYSSNHRFPPQIYDYFNEVIEKRKKDGSTYHAPRHSVGGYSGSCYSDYLWIDLDSSDLMQAFQSAKAFILHIESQYEVDVKTLELFFSGFKGLHIGLSSKLFGFTPLPHLNEVQKLVVRRILPEGMTVDESIYDKVRLLRIKNTINSKSGLYKIPISVDELFNLSIPEIKELAKEPRKGNFHDPNVSLNSVLNQLYLKAEEEIQGRVSKADNGSGKTYKEFIEKGAATGNRHHSIISLAGMLKTRGIPLDEAVPICLSINKTHCTPPKEDESVIKAVEDIYRRYENTEGNHFGFKTTPWQNLIGKEEPEIEFLIEDLLPLACLIILAGKPKLGKSLLALLLALSIGLGKSLWGKKVKQGGVLFVSTEDGEIRLKKRIWKMIGDPDKHTPNFDFYCGDCILTRKDVFEAFKAKVLELKPKLIVLDPLINLFRGRELNSGEDMNAVLRPLQTLAKETKACVLVIHHARKSSGEDSIDMVQGSITISGVADGIILLRSLRGKDEEKLATLEVILKDAEVPQKVVLKLDDKLRWNVEGNFEEVMSRNLEEDLEKTLRDEPNGLTIAVLMQILQVDYFRLYRIFQRWEAENKVSSKQVGRSHTKVYSLQSECKAKTQSEKTDVTNGSSFKNNDKNSSLCTDTNLLSEDEKMQNVQSEGEPEYLK